MIKLNWDAGVNVKEGRVGLGLIARDSRGHCLNARSMTLECQTKASMAEALAAVHAVMLCKEMGYVNVTIEGDALQVIRAIATTDPCLSSYGHMIECIHRELRSLENVSFIHVIRGANTATHMLARMATSWGMFHLMYVMYVIYVIL